jgi:hypothetical protein
MGTSGRTLLAVNLNGLAVVHHNEDPMPDEPLSRMHHAVRGLALLSSALELRQGASDSHVPLVRP